MKKNVAGVVTKTPIQEKFAAIAAAKAKFDVDGLDDKTFNELTAKLDLVEQDALSTAPETDEDLLRLAALHRYHLDAGSAHKLAATAVARALFSLMETTPEAAGIPPYMWGESVLAEDEALRDARSTLAAARSSHPGSLIACWRGNSSSVVLFGQDAAAAAAALGLDWNSDGWPDVEDSFLYVQVADLRRLASAGLTVVMIDDPYFANPYFAKTIAA